MVRAILRIYSFVYLLPLAAFLTGIAVVAFLSGLNLNLEMLPWKGAALDYWVFGLGVSGLLFAVLALLGKARILYALWALAVLALMFWGFFLGRFTFANASQFQGAVWLTLGAFGALMGALLVWRNRPERR